VLCLQVIIALGRTTEKVINRVVNAHATNAFFTGVRIFFHPHPEGILCHWFQAGWTEVGNHVVFA
jgi:hypothetical protein